MNVGTVDRVSQRKEGLNSNEPKGYIREFERGTVSITGSLQLSNGPKFKVVILDISPAGFRLQTANYIAPNHIVYLTIPGFEPFQARVAWNYKEQYGCQLTRKIHSAVFAHISESFPKLAAA